MMSRAIDCERAEASSFCCASSAVNLASSTALISSGPSSQNVSTEVKTGEPHAGALQPDAPRKLPIDGHGAMPRAAAAPSSTAGHRRSGWRGRRRSCLRACVAVAEGGLPGVRHLDPLLGGRTLGGVIVVPIPPLVGRALGVALRRVFPRLLATERRRIEVAPGAPHRLVAAAVDEVRAKHALA